MRFSNGQFKRHRSSAGFTLVEFLLYIAISSSVLLLAVTFLGTTLEAGVKNQSITEVDQQGILAMEILTQTIRNASSISLPNPGGNGSTLMLTVPNAGESPTTVTTGGTALTLQKGLGSPAALTNTFVEVTNLQFENRSASGSPGTVRIRFTLSRVNGSGRNEYTYTKDFIGSASLRQP